MVRLSVYGINVILETDNPGVKYMLESEIEDRVFSPWMKQWITKKVRKKIYNRCKTDKTTGHLFFEIGVGFASYLLKIFAQEIPKSDYDDVCSAICQENYRTNPFPELRDYQNEDILHVLKYKFGIISVQTGYGKTSTIACLSNYYLSQGMKVLIVTPNSKPRDEVIKRIWNNYGIEVSTKIGTGQIQAYITTGLLNRNDVLIPEKEREFIKELESFDVIMVDELEYCSNNAGYYIFSHATNVKVRYGFSGTSDKASAKLISFANGINDPVVAKNIDLIKYFGTSLVYKKPLDRIVNMISVKSEALNGGNLKLWEIMDDCSNVYIEIMVKILSNPKVSELMMKVVNKYPLTFIPVNNLSQIIYHWIDNYFYGKYNILLICGEGYLYYDIGGGKSKLTLQEACDKVKTGLVNVIFSTSSGWRALDIPNLQNIIVLQGQIAGSILQQIGRVARLSEFNIICLEPKNGKALPVYTKAQKTQKELIREYYSYCKINEITVNEEEL